MRSFKLLVESLKKDRANLGRELITPQSNLTYYYYLG